MHKCQLDRFSAKEAISGEKCAAMHLESKPRLAAGITCHNLTDSPEKKTSTAVTDSVCAKADIIVRVNIYFCIICTFMIAVKNNCLININLFIFARVFHLQWSYINEC